MGYSLEQKDALTQDAIKGGFKKEYLVKTGLTIEGDNYLVDRFRGRVIFPIHTLSGKTVGFGGRILKKVENTGKYVNSPESEIYHKSDHLYGIYFAKQSIAKLDRCYLVEGYTDVISMHQAGLENVVASSGTALTEGQIRLIHRFTPNITILYDGDAAGIKAALRGIDLLLEDGMNVKVVLLPEGEDPDSFARKQNADSLNKYLKENEVDFIRFKTQLLLDDAGNDPIKRAALISDIVHSISIIPDGIIRSVYIRDCSVLLGIDERVLISEVNKKRLAVHDKNSQKAPQAPISSINLTEDTTFVQDSKSVSNTGLGKYELAILYYVVRFGSLALIQRQAEDGEEIDNTTVLEYIIFDLERDGLTFQNTLYNQILEEATSQMQDSNFIPSRYFLAHPNQNISRLAAELLEDRYELSKIHMRQYGENLKQEETPLAEEKQLESAVPRVLTELKNAFISERIKAIKDQMKQKQKQGDMDGSIALMQQLKDLEDVKKALAKILGERVVLHW